MLGLRRAAAVLRRRRLPPWAAMLAVVGAYMLVQALEEGAASPPARSIPAWWERWKRILTLTYEGVGEKRLLALAAGVVFYALLALFPAITALVSSYALFADPSTIGTHLAELASFMPASAYSIVNEQVTRIVGHATSGLSLAFVFGLALALWSANAGAKAIIDALNVVYGVRERRSFIRLNLVSLCFTIGTIAGLLLAIGAIVVLPVWLSYLPLFGFEHSLVTWLRWPALLALLLFGMAVLYRFGPDLDHPQWRWFSPGAVLASIAWLIGSALLSWYLANFANYDATYGSLGAAIGLMMWLWMSAIVVLAGAELNSAFDEVTGADDAAKSSRA